MLNRYWFKPKRFGRGITPISKEGWFVTIAMIIAFLIPFVIVVLIGELDAVPEALTTTMIIALVLSFIIRGTIICVLVRPVTYGTLKRRRGYEEELKANPNNRPTSLS